ncbi:unnamed protein product [Didymodactylos carnosus]|uniref:M23ase beta-sheet core domain-containing protein n=1 Tax=Didymodactylos carnosus TaxID=1234261 RepID=A0A813Y1Z6_9BILA|nr:unnamed protein product [Didymodactylos carnosus]CAF0875683.1 unnamed protein product [Didymodactylos carnosus]CAF3524860.1 unnamed protein product [Didymodactylos carnosus]CAF3662592.1 unnamed protein product [Didymodactylos carnosus]
MSFTSPRYVKVTSTDPVPNYLIHPDRLANELIQCNYEQIYSQTSQSFKDEVPWNKFLNVVQSFNDSVQQYHAVAELKHNDTLRKVWRDELNTRGVMAVFAEKHMKYPDYTILAMQVRRLQLYPATDQIRTQTIFSPPIEQDWQVIWGGTNALINHHYDYDNQRYAYDLIITHNGSSFEGDPQQNESYYAYCKPVVAPANGIVVKVVSDIKDNKVVGKMNEKHPAGNYVVIRHADKEYSMLGHFRKSSITVKVDDQVQRGQKLGACGNSGNSSEPHIHFQVMDEADWSRSTSLPVRFASDISPVQGEVMPGSLL